MAEPNFRNRTLYHGDNLDFLRGMNSETVHLIATDPPFNKNRDFHATPDSLASGAKFQDRWSWERDVHEDWQDSIIDDWPAVWEVITAARASYGDGMAAFLCWQGVRLMEMHRVLRNNGSLYLHCDPTASHYLKLLLDAIFGWRNVINEIVWCYIDPAGRRNSSHYKRTHDIIFWYAKDHKSRLDSNIPKGPLSPSTIKRYEKYFDANGQISYAEIKRTNPGVFKALKSVPDDLSMIWLDRNKGTNMPDWWSDIAPIKRKGKRQKSESTGYPTQKPLALYERIIAASSNEGDIVLDPFCGCATTPIAAEMMKRQWVGMDMWDGAREQVIDRLSRDTILRTNENHHVTLPQVHYETTPPGRTDDNEIAAPVLRLKIQRPVLPWQKITHKGMMNILAEAQSNLFGVVCAGCGRILEREFLQLDHITPKSDRGENHILNRVLLCGPCNRRKRDNLTLRGLMRENKKKAVGWMKDENEAKRAQDKAREKAEWARDHFHTRECQNLIGE